MIKKFFPCMIRASIFIESKREFDEFTRIDFNKPIQISGALS